MLPTSSSATIRPAGTGASSPKSLSSADPYTARAPAIRRLGSARCRAPLTCTTTSAPGYMAAMSPVPPAWSRWMCVTTTVARSAAPTPRAASAACTTGADAAVPVSTRHGRLPLIRYPAVMPAYPAIRVSIWKTSLPRSVMSLSEYFPSLLAMSSRTRLLSQTKEREEPMDLMLSEYSAAPGSTVIAVSGEIDVYTAPRLREAIVSLTDAGNYRLIVDMEGVEFLDSTGLGVLVGGLKRVRAHDGAIDLVCTQGRILRIFRITGLSRVFNIYDSVDEALASHDKPAVQRRPPGAARPHGSNVLSTSPVRGLGPNDVDLRGTRSPCAATSLTAASGIGLQMTAVPPASSAIRIASPASCEISTSRSLSLISHSWASSSSCMTEASSARQRGDASAGIAAASWASSGWVSSQQPGRPTSRNAVPSRPAAASRSTAAGTSPGGTSASFSTVNAAAASRAASSGARCGITRWIAPSLGG